MKLLSELLEGHDRKLLLECQQKFLDLLSSDWSVTIRGQKLFFECAGIPGEAVLKDLTYEGDDDTPDKVTSFYKEYDIQAISTTVKTGKYLVDRYTTTFKNVNDAVYGLMAWGGLPHSMLVEGTAEIGQLVDYMEAYVFPA